VPGSDYLGYTPDAAEAALLAIIGRYGPRIELEIERFLADALTDDGYITEAGIAKRQRVIDGLLKKASNEVRQWENTQLQEYYNAYVKQADDELERARINLSRTLISGAHTLHKRAFSNLKLEFERHISDSFGVVARKANDDFRQVQIASAMRGFAGTDNIKNVIKGIRQDLEERGITGFTDRSGREWTLRNYSDMAARTVTARARRRAKEMEFLAHGEDLVIVSEHYPTCEKCVMWGGKILSLTGSTPGYPTLAEAEAEGLFHPRCRHTASLYTPEMSEWFGVEEVTTDEAQEKNKQAREDAKALMAKQLEDERAKRRGRYREKKASATNRNSTKDVIIAFDKGQTKNGQENKLNPRKNDSFSKSQEIVDEAIGKHLKGIRFTMKPVYNDRIKNNGRTVINVLGNKKTVKKVEIGRQEHDSEFHLLDTLIHEELEARIAVRADRNWHGKYGKMFGKIEQTHKYIYAVIARYFRVKGWVK
jgi:hypothetical protein